MAGSNEALADAVSGVVGTLVSLWCFYPIERIKTNLQAGKALSAPKADWSSSIKLSENDSDRFQRQLRILIDLLRKSFRGCLTKSTHATSSSFCYFYFYSWILSYYNNKRRLRLQRGNGISGQSYVKLTPLRPSTRLVLSAIAAMMNTFVTLPLDVLSSKRTVECDNENDAEEIDTTILTANPETDSKSIMDKTWNSIEKKGGKPLPELATSTTCTSSSSSSSSSSTIEMVFHEACSRSEDLFALHGENEERENDNNTSINSNNSTTSSSNSIVSNNEEYKLRWKERQEALKSLRLNRKRLLQQSKICDEEDVDNANKIITKVMNIRNITKNIAVATNTKDAIDCIRRWSKLWKGLTPALLLCSNPSIHYTVFDVLKTKMLAWKRLRNPRRAQQRQLSVSEAFVLGLLSKFVATIVTYPLIRAKVLMMVGGHSSTKAKNHQVEDQSNETKSSASSSTEHSPNLWSVLQESYHRDGGIPGLYKGCDWQLIHTLLKSALMMAVREQITDKTRAAFGVSSK